MNHLFGTSDPEEMNAFVKFFETILTDPVTFFFCALITIWLVSALVPLFRPSANNNGRSARFIEITATSLATLGILGTFTGILIGLLNFDVERIDDSVPQLLEGLKTAFTTSIVGIIAAIIFRICRTFSPVKTSSGGIGPEDILQVLEEIRDNARMSSELSSRQLQDVRSAISSDGDSSLLTQIQKVRSDAKDNHEALIEEFRNFASHMVENNQRAIIEALEQVIRDFNQNLTEQFGENFSQLNEAVQELVQWQENYRLHVETLEGRLENSVMAIESSQQALESVQNHAEQIPQMIEHLEPVLEGLSSLTQVLEAHLQTIADLKDQAVEAFPIIENNLQTLTTEMSECVTDVVSQARSAVSVSEELHSSLREDQRALIQQVEEAQANFNSQLETALTRMNEQARQGFERHSEIIQQSAEKSQNTLNSAWEESVRKMDEQFTNFDEQMQQEMNRSLQVLGSNLASITEKLVEDYMPITDKLREIVNINTRVN